MNIIFIVITSVLSVLIASFPDASLAAARDAHTMCGNIIIPSLFPYFVCANILTALGISKYLSKAFGRFMMPLFNIGGAGALALILGLLSGYPCGAATACRLYDEGSLEKNEAERLVAFANNSGPLFIISAVGIGIFHSQKAGIILYISHIAGAILTGFVFRFFGKSHNKSNPAKLKKASVFAAVGDSVISIITLCGYIIFFAVILAMLRKTGLLALSSGFLKLFGISSEDSVLLTSGLFEITSGLNSSHSVNLPLVSLILSLGGVSVLLQTYSFLRKSSLSLKPYIAGKLLSGGFSALCTKIILCFYPVEVSVFSFWESPKTAFYINYLTAFLLAFFIFMAFGFLRKSR